MLRTTNPSRVPELRWLLGMCLAITMGGCAAEYGEEGVTNEVGEPIITGYTDVGGTVSEIAISTKNNAVDIFGIGTDGKIYHNNGTPGVWDGPVGSNPAPGATWTSVAAVQRGTTTDVVAVSGATHVVAITYGTPGTLAWSSWQRAGATAMATDFAPAVSQVTGDNRTDVWVVADGVLRHTTKLWASDSWFGWFNDGAPAGVTLTGAPAVFTRSGSPLVIDVTVRDTNRNLWARAYSVDHWLPWASMNFITNDDPAIGSTGSKITIMARKSGRIYQSDYTSGTGWSAFTATYEPPQDPKWILGPNLVYQANGTLRVAVIDGDNSALLF